MTRRLYLFYTSALLIKEIHMFFGVAYFQYI